MVVELIPSNAAPFPVFVNDIRFDALFTLDVYGNVRPPPASAAGAHCVPLNFNTWPFVGTVLLTAMFWILLTSGLG